ncbi:glycerol-3-phosphate 1-O-acyltransferase PlsY [Streptococcus saliviloxodontae]|uniref:Glycerol-3-phosphate acyltransferase n=1 Tax=Streptococcus saliviloxodontae TaxID=1349416 RepID=A0ABS2PNP4_9STRE|nr:glycerol-3-phosphate 1-O-acyltransferase PlsY [Streptococcus saliviloxodontae]MBM7637057.1 glycerol-3-phosphate acyltransferase PlsY [Streptococcus saliviloxodontae]
MKIIGLFIIAYLLGSIPTGLWIGKRFYHTNLREHGSGNTGTTNTFRILGFKAGVTTLSIDILKGTLATLLPVWLGVTEVSPLLIGFLAILGHTFPIFAHFKGGKAVATSAGVLLGFAPLYLLFLLLIFGLTLYLYSMISLSSIIAAIVGILTVLTFPACHFILKSYDPLFTIIIIIMGSFIIYRHKDNIHRIRSKSENLVPFGLNLSKQIKK